MREELKSISVKFKEEKKEQHIQWAVSYCLERAKGLNHISNISTELGIPDSEREVFELLLAMSILEKESKPKDRVQDPLDDNSEDPLSEALSNTPLLNLGYRSKETDSIALERMGTQLREELDKLPQDSPVRGKNASHTAHLITSIYIQCVKEQGNLSEYFAKRKEYIKKQFTV
jgi:hypothetical protein